MHFPVTDGHMGAWFCVSSVKESWVDDCSELCKPGFLVISTRLCSKIKSHLLVLPVFCARGYADYLDLCKSEFGDQYKTLIKAKSHLLKFPVFHAREHVDLSGLCEARVC